MTRFFDGLVAGAQRSEKAMKNVSAAVEEFNKNIKERGGVLGRGATDKTLAGTGGFTGVGLTQSQARMLPKLDETFSWRSHRSTTRKGYSSSYRGSKKINCRR